MRVLLPLPNDDFDPSEAAVPWQTLSSAGVEVVVATPDGGPAQADSIVLEGTKLGLFKAVLRTDANARAAYAEFHKAACGNPRSYEELSAEDFDGIVLPGGHAPKMKPYLESETLRALIADFFAADKIVAAVCHGVLAVSRTLRPDGKSVLYGRKTTALTERMEMFAWKRTRKSLGSYYRTYPQSVQSEVTEALQAPADFFKGPPPLFHDTPHKLSRGFVVEDGNYISARYPGDVHRFADAILRKLKQPAGASESA